MFGDGTAMGRSLMPEDANPRGIAFLDATFNDFNTMLPHNYGRNTTVSLLKPDGKGSAWWKRRIAIEIKGLPEPSGPPWYHKYADDPKFARTKAVDTIARRVRELLACRARAVT